jgi:hypothetical protein
VVATVSGCVFDGLVVVVRSVVVMVGGSRVRTLAVGSVGWQLGQGVGGQVRWLLVRWLVVCWLVVGSVVVRSVVVRSVVVRSVVVRLEVVGSAGVGRLVVRLDDWWLGQMVGGWVRWLVVMSDSWWSAQVVGGWVGWSVVGSGGGGQIR